MKAYKVELLIIDYDELGESVIRDTLANTRYANDCISPHVKRITPKDIGEWSDDHPINKKDEHEEYYRQIFRGHS